MPNELNRTGSTGKHLLAPLRKYFLAGLVIVVPIAAAVWALVWVFNAIDSILQPVIRDVIIRWINPEYHGNGITGLGFIITILLIFLVGIIASNYVGHRFIKYSESLLSRVPVFRQIYSALKQVVEGITGLGLNKAAFRKVVFVEFPLAGMRTIGFVTNELTDTEGNKLFSVFIPTSPTPTTGYYMIATPDRIYSTNLNVDEAMKLVISAGIIAPQVLEMKNKDTIQ